MNEQVTVFHHLIDLVTYTLAVFLVYVLVEANVRLISRWGSRTWLLTLIYAFLAALSFFKGVEVAPGVRMDARYGVVVAATLTLGALSGLVVAVVAAVMRLWVGGMGALPGIGVLLLAWGGTLAVMARHRRQALPQRQAHSWRVAIESACAGASAPVLALGALDLWRGYHASAQLYVAIALTQFLVALILWFAIQLTASRTQALSDLQASNQALAQSFRQTVGALAAAVLHRDPGAAAHQKRVAHLAVMVGRKLGLAAHRLEALELAALVHDIGQIEIPSEILSRPGALTPAEMALVRLHPQIGYDILKNVSTPWPLAEIVAQHHENLDGSGYPRQLRGEAISIEARILRVCDIVEAMSSHRAFRAAVGLDAALQEIQRMAGKQLDPRVVRACVDLFEKDGYHLPAS